MKRTSIPVLLATIFTFLFATTSFCAAEQKEETQSGAPGWMTDYDAALVKAKESGRRVLIDFTGSDWCYWCIRMEEETFSKKAFKDYADEHLVLVYVDTPRNKKIDMDLAARNKVLIRHFGVDGFPTFVVLDPDGHEIDRRSGYVSGGPDNFIRFLKVTEASEKIAK